MNDLDRGPYKCDADNCPGHPGPENYCCVECQMGGHR